MTCTRGIHARKSANCARDLVSVESEIYTRYGRRRRLRSREPKVAFDGDQLIIGALLNIGMHQVHDTCTQQYYLVRVKVPRAVGSRKVRTAFTFSGLQRENITIKMCRLQLITLLGPLYRFGGKLLII